MGARIGTEGNTVAVSVQVAPVLTSVPVLVSDRLPIPVNVPERLVTEPAFEPVIV